MSDTKHTPGPWKTRSDIDNPRLILDENNVNVAEVFGEGSIRRSNVALIAASPDLLEAADRVLDGWDHPPMPDGAMGRLRAAITKARGGA